MTAPVITPTVQGDAQLANKWVLQVNTAFDPAASSQPAADYITVFGMSSFTPSVTANTQDDSDFDSNGWASSKVTSRAWELTGTVQRKRYNAAEDPGQAHLRAQAFLGKQVQVRYFDRYHGEEAYSGYAAAQWSPQGGGVTDLETANFTLTGNGALTEISNPNNFAPAITAANPATDAAGGDTVTITGSGFYGLTGATAVKFGSDNATSYIVDSDTQIRAVMPAGADGSANITVTNPTGTSTAFTYARAA